MVAERRRLSIWWIILITLAPLLLGAFFVLSVTVHGWVRYDPQYFEPEYVAEYDTPGAVARALEHALQTDDQVLIAELEGLRRPVPLKAAPDIILVMLAEEQGPYLAYLYFNLNTYKRIPHYVEPVCDRWVVAPADAYYYYHSGEWLKVFIPVTIIWWLLEAVILLMRWVFRASRRLRPST